MIDALSKAGDATQYLRDGAAGAAAGRPPHVDALTRDGMGDWVRC